MAHYVVFGYDRDPDLSWLLLDQYDPSHPSYEPAYRTLADMRAKRSPIDGGYYRNPDNHVTLKIVTYARALDGRDSVVDSFGGIDFLRDDDNWTLGDFYFVNDIPKRCRYQRQLAREAGLRYRPRRRTRA